MSKCTACMLGAKNNTYNAVKGWGNPDAPLIVYMDCPGDVLAEKLFVWIMKRLGLDGNDCWVDYTFKCALPKGLKKKELVPCQSICWTVKKRRMNGKATVLAGNHTADFLAGDKMKDWHGRKDEAGFWITYSFKYLLMNPAECVDAWRVLYKAAEEAGLKPRMVLDVEPFKFPTRKMVAG